MKKLFAVTAALAGMLLVIAPASCKTPANAGNDVLKFNLEKGKTYDYEIVWDMDQKISGQDTKISLTGTYSVEVTGERDKVKSLTAVYQNFKLYLKMMGLEMDIDTEKPAPPIDPDKIKENPMGMMARVFSGIKGKKFDMQVDEEGKVLSVSGFDAIINGMIDSTGVEGDMRLQMQASLSDQFNEQAIKDQFAQVFTIFPNKKVKVGDNWEKSFEMGGKMPAKFSTVYTVKQIEGDQLTLDAKTAISPSGDQAELKGTQTGILLVDGKTGLVRSADFTQHMETTVQGMDLKIAGKGKIKGKER